MHLFLGLAENFEPLQIACPAVTMTSYSEEISKKADVLFSKDRIQNTLGQVVSDQGKRQLRIGETEKYAHVTFFFNGRREEPFSGEDRILIPSPKVTSYDSAPEMSAGGITDSLTDAIRSTNYDFILVNYANADMVGHTGNFRACVRGVEFLDLCLDKVSKAVNSVGGTMIVTADHGNAEEMAMDGKIHKAHTLNLVPFVVTGAAASSITLKQGGALCNVAPTALEIMSMHTPSEMTHSLIEKIEKVK